jgi:RNA polymerase primary sigma factor
MVQRAAPDQSQYQLVVSIAKRYMGTVYRLDLIRKGTWGLMKAVEKYDYRGFRFSTCHMVDTPTITRAIADQARTIRVPVHMTDRIRQFYKTSRGRRRLGRQATVEELAWQ